MQDLESQLKGEATNAMPTSLLFVDVDGRVTEPVRAIHSELSKYASGDL